MLLLVAFVALAGGNAVLAQPVPGEDEDPPDVPGIVDENEPGIDPAVLEDFNENFAPWLQPPGLSIEGLPKPIGFELWKTGGGPELVRTFSNELGAWQAAERAEAEAFSKRTGLPLELNIAVPVRRAETPVPSPEGPRIPAPPSWFTEPSTAVMVGVEHGLPVYLRPLNAESADAIGTDELWETTVASVITNGLSGLNLNGEGTQLAMWDKGNVLTNHQEFAIANSMGEVSSRVIDGEGPGSSFGGSSQHATHIAGTLVAAGVNPRARGMSPEATLLSYDFAGDFREMTAAFVNTNNHFRISSHSYGQMTGWDGTHFNAPFWRGNLSISATEDYNFGFYNTYSQGIDDIIYWCRYYLPVWAAGNERGEITGRPSLTLTNGYWAYTNRVIGNFENDSEGRPKRDENGNLIRQWTTNRIARFTPPGGTPPPPAYDYRVNGGYDLLYPHAVAKNSLVVGAVNKIAGGYGLLTTNVIMTDFSSWGPTDDGRIKPDIVTAGNSIYSTDTNQPGMINKSYDHASGTSYATPTVVGSLNLLIQLHRRQVGNNQPMLASTLRALAIHTADEAGDHPGPDYRFGWGLFNALSAANLMTNNFHSDSLAHIKEVPLYNIRTVVTNGITNNYTDYIKFPVVARGNEPLKVTLCWNDPPPQTLLSPALDPTNRMLVNDLDLRLAHSTTTIDSDTNIITSTKHFRPWILDPANPARAARRDRNSRDNVEQVVVESPTTNGVYEVQVTQRGGRRRLTFPLRPMTGSAMAYTNQTVLTNQWVSLLISGNTPQPEPRLRPRLLSPGDGTIALSWPSVVGRVYQVDCRPFVWGGKWEPASGEIAATQTNTAVVLGGSSAQRYYQIRRVR